MLNTVLTMALEAHGSPLPLAHDVYAEPRWFHTHSPTARITCNTREREKVSRHILLLIEIKSHRNMATTEQKLQFLIVLSLVFAGSIIYINIPHNMKREPVYHDVYPIGGPDWPRAVCYQETIPQKILWTPET